MSVLDIRPTKKFGPLNLAGVSSCLIVKYRRIQRALKNLHALNRFGNGESLG